MVDSLLETKLYIPRSRPEIVHRPRLIERLNNGLHRKLTLVSAPAGFGKTSLLAEWFNNLHFRASKKNEETMGIGWYSIDLGDNDPKRFLTYFVAALKKLDGLPASLGDSAIKMLDSTEPPPNDIILTSLLNDIAGVSKKLIVTLDDFHLIDSIEVQEALAFILENSPSHLHLIISTREDPSIPLSRLRAGDQITEMRAADLRFTISETADFLNVVMGLRLSDGDIRALESRTEGWIVGLHLAAISLRGREDVTDQIKSFSGSHRLVLDYLIEEVLSQQPKMIQDFLIKTSILSQLTGSLCNALTGVEDGQQILELLEHTNLFIIPLDSDRRWYRYHHLFEDLLQQRLRRENPNLVPDMHIRASKWYIENGFFEIGIEHSFSANEYQRVADLLEEHADALWQGGNHVNFMKWAGKLPEKFVQSKPKTSIINAHYLFSNGQHSAGEHLLQMAEEALSLDNNLAPKKFPSSEWEHLSDLERKNLRGRAGVVRSLYDAFRGDVPNTIRNATNALEDLSEDDLNWRNLAAFALGDAHSFLGDMAASYEARSEAAALCQVAGDSYYILSANLKLISTLREQGELHQALELCQNQLLFAEESGLLKTGSASCLFATHGEILTEYNDLEAAKKNSKASLELIVYSRNLAILGFCYLYLVRIYFSSGNFAQAEEIINSIQKKSQVMDVPPWVLDQLMNWQVRIWIVEGKLSAVSKWAEEYKFTTQSGNPSTSELDYFRLISYIAYARFLVAKNEFQRALELLDQLQKAAEAGERISRIIEIKIIQALVYQEQQDMEKALTELEGALTTAKSKGFIRIFVDEGPPMAQLLLEALSQGIEPESVRHLLGSFAAKTSKQVETTKAQQKEYGYYEALSNRECEVLQLIAIGLTNSEIADRLFLSKHTIKTHTRNIYSKLGAKNRTQAVAQGRELGLISSE